MPAPAEPSATNPAAAFLRREWRVLLFFLALMAVTALVATLVDRGHDPLWQRDLPHEIDSVSYAPSGDRIYVLQTLVNNGTPIALTALDAQGRTVWEAPLDASSVRFAAGDGFVAVATAPSPSNLTVLSARDGRLLWETLITRGFTTGLDADGDLLAMALPAPAEVQVFRRGADNFTQVASLAFPEENLNVVRAVAVHRGTVAAGDEQGNLVVWRNGSRLLTTQVPLKVLSLALADGGDRLLVGGASLTPGDLTGRVMGFDLRAPTASQATRWDDPVAGSVRFLALTDGGAQGLALVNAPGGPQVRGYPDAANAGGGWSVGVDKVVRDALANRGAAVDLDPAGAGVAYVNNIGGSVTLLDAATGEERWTYRAVGGNALDYAPGGGAFVVAARTLTGQPVTTLLYFEEAREPFWLDLSRLVPALIALEALMAIGAIAVRGLWARR